VRDAAALNNPAETAGNALPETLGATCFADAGRRPAVSASARGPGLTSRCGMTLRHSESQENNETGGQLFRAGSPGHRICIPNWKRLTRTDVIVDPRQP